MTRAFVRPMMLALALVAAGSTASFAQPSRWVVRFPRPPIGPIQQVITDIAPINTGWNFCTLQSAGTQLLLVVTVKNQGNQSVPATLVAVQFSSGTRAASVPALAPGATASVLLVIPPGCFQSDCGFSITVDAGAQVQETNESNNTAGGWCIG